MIDTIIFEIPIEYKTIIYPEKFKPNTRQLEVYKGFGRCVNNPTKEDKDKGIYKPKLTALKRGRQIFLKVEFSAPKILFNNNLDEVEETDFNKALERLKEVVREMGVILTTEQIEKANVIGVHPSKNIPLSKEYIANFAIRELAKVNITEKLDIESIKFRNQGEALQFYSVPHSLVIYDKINDLNKPAQRAIDKDQTAQQFSLFAYIKKERSDLEILRIEVRLSKKRKMNEIIKKVGYLANPTFKDVFKKDLSQKILNLYWTEIFGENLFLFSVNNNPQKILQLILRKYPKTKIRTAVIMTGINLLCKDEEGIRGFRNIAKNYKPKFNWPMLNRYLKKFKDDIFINPEHGFVKDIRDNLKEFESFKINRHP